MAARRLIIVMVVLLTISTVAAAFAPRRETEDAPRPEPVPKGAGDDATEDRGIKRVRTNVTNAKPMTIFVRPGQELILSVGATFGDEVEIPALGLIESMSIYAPAVFNIFADRIGTFPVRTVQSDRLVATIEVAEQRPKPDADAEPGPKPEGGPKPEAGPKPSTGPTPDTGPK